jgi:hypothetical protein
MEVDHNKEVNREVIHNIQIKDLEVKKGKIKEIINLNKKTSQYNKMIKVSNKMNNSKQIM